MSKSGFASLQMKFFNDIFLFYLTQEFSGQSRFHSAGTSTRNGNEFMDVNGLVRFAIIGFAAIVSCVILLIKFRFAHAHLSTQFTTKDDSCQILTATKIRIRRVCITKVPSIACALDSQTAKDRNSNVAMIVTDSCSCRMIRNGALGRVVITTLASCRGMKLTKCRRYRRGSMTFDHIIRVAFGKTNKALAAKHSASKEDQRKIAFRINRQPLLRFSVIHTL